MSDTEKLICHYYKCPDQAWVNERSVCLYDNKCDLHEEEKDGR